MAEVIAVVLAGGRGTRVGAGRNKVLLELAGLPVINWSVRAFATHPRIDGVIVVAHPDDLASISSAIREYGDIPVIPGGAERADSERAALHYLRARIDSGEVGGVLIHDGARPLVSAALIDRVCEVVLGRGVLPVLPAPPLLQAAADGSLRSAGPDLYRAQTPQGGPAAALLTAYDAALADGFAGTDTASYLERIGEQVVAVAGDVHNLKITYPQDLQAAHELLAQYQGAPEEC